ncbi:MAG: zinc ribbon domain-containing protein [Cetobacterium sp.]|nr:zinc ribbon domain-containing protein [Cetobacterium sp.]
MFFIGIFGIGTQDKFLREVSFKCTGCLENNAELFQLGKTFQLFFIPLYTFGITYVLKCETCNSLYKINSKSIDKILSTGNVSYDDIKEIIYEHDVHSNNYR